MSTDDADIFEANDLLSNCNLLEKRTFPRNEYNKRAKCVWLAWHAITRVRRVNCNTYFEILRYDLEFLYNLYI